MAVQVRLLAQIMYRIDSALQTVNGGARDFLLEAKRDLQYAIDTCD